MGSLTGPQADVEGAQPDDLGQAHHRRRTLAWVGGLAAVVVAGLPVAVGFGPVDISYATVWQVITHHLVGLPREVTWSTAQDSIVWDVRVPRVLLGAVVGAGLAASGVVLQALVRNVLADPYLLGVTGGASTGAAATLLFGVGLAAGSSSLTASAFLGAMLATVAVFALARFGGRITSVRLLLAGVAVGYVLSALTSFLVFASDAPEGARAVMFWLLGSLAQARWSSVLVAGIVVGCVLLVLQAWGRRMDALAIGDETARTLGVDPTRFRAQALVAVSLMVGAVVAVSGGIGFVGLVVPHVARSMVGSEHRRALPVAALVGAAFLVAADLFARLVFAPRELPLGIVTAFVGAPFLVLLLRRFHQTAM